MSTEANLLTRSGSKCELCTASETLSVYEIPPSSNGEEDQCILICETCRQQIEDLNKIESDHWRCLNDSMWSQVPAVQVMAWRMLTRLNTESWAQGLLEMLYLDDELLQWAQALDEGGDATASRHVDSNGTVLSAGDTVTLTKDLTVKGANFTAKRGTAVRGISLVSDNPDHLEGRINGQQIVILTKFVKLSK